MNRLMYSSNLSPFTKTQKNMRLLKYISMSVLTISHFYHQLAEQLYQTMTKRFKDTDSVWTQYGLFLMKQGRPDAARKILEKSLKAVHKKQRKNLRLW